MYKPGTQGIPHDGWRSGVLGDVVSAIRGGFSVKCEDRPAAANEKGVLKTGAVLGRVLDVSQHKYVPAQNHARLRTPIRAGTVVFCRKNSEEVIGATALVVDDVPNIYLSDLLWEISPSESTDLYWLASVLQSDGFRKRVQFESTGTQSTMKNISQDRLRGIRIAIPPYSDQCRVRDILKTWDYVLDRLEKLRQLKECRLASLRSSLLFGERRLKGRLRSWTMVRLGEVTYELTSRNEDLELQRNRVMGVTNTAGIVPMREQTMSGDIRRYKRVPPRAYAYNPMRINVGSIAMNVSQQDILVSPDYVVFACKDGDLAPDYMDHLRKTKWWSHYISSGGSGSVRQRTYYADLAALKLALPSLDEQNSICTILNAAHNDLKLTEREASAIQYQKRGLMQKLLTGEWRVPATMRKTEVG